MKKILFVGLFYLFCNVCKAQENSWIRINQLGYPTQGIKVAVWCSKQNNSPATFELVDAVTQKTVYQHSTGKSFGAYGPFTATHRLDFSAFTKKGKYFLRTGKTQSPVFTINDDVYKG